MTCSFATRDSRSRRRTARGNMRHPVLALMFSMMVSLLIVSCESGAIRMTSLAPSSTHASTAPPSPTAAPTATAVIAPTPTAVPEPTRVRMEPTQVSTAEGVAMETGANAPHESIVQNDAVTLTIIYDNNAHKPELRTAWGFACLVETEAGTVLFDTGADSPTLLGNMDKLGIAPPAIDAVVLSHIHGDHIGGLMGLLDTGISPRVYAPATFPHSFKESISVRTSLVEVTGPVEVMPGITTTGEVGKSIIEQALAVETKQGLIVVTGCAHPGIVEMVRRAKGTFTGDVALVIGGFHLGGADKGQIEQIIQDFQHLGVRRCAPCHCTGDQARRMFVDAYGANCVLGGVGQVIVIGTDRVQVME